MPIGPVTPGSPVDVSPDASPALYRKIQAPTATMLVRGSDLQALTLALLNSVNAVGIPQLVMKASNWSKFFVPSTAVGVLLSEPINATVVAAGENDGVSYAQEGLDTHDWHAGTLGSAQTIIIRWGVVDPTHGIILVGATDNTHIYRSVDGGVNWTTVNLPITPKGAAGAGPAIWDPVNSQFVICGAGEIAYSANGTAWTRVAVAGLDVTSMHRGIAVDDSGNYLAGGTGSANVWKSTDAGHSWTSHATPSSAGDTRESIVWNSFDQQWVIVGGLYAVTSPDGITWTAVASGPVGTLHDLAVDGALYVATMANSGGIGVAYSVDKAQSWNHLYLRDTGSGWSTNSLTLSHFRGAFYIVGADSFAGGAMRSLRINLPMTDITP